MTQKEMFELAKSVIVNEVDSLSTEDEAAIVAMFDKYIKQLSKRSSKANVEAAEFAAAVATYMADHDFPEDLNGFTNKMLAAEIGVSSQKMSAALRTLVKKGVVDRIEPEAAKDPVLFVLTTSDTPSENF